MNGTWLTNDPEVAAKWRAADEAFEAARKAAPRWPLADKVEAYRRAAIERLRAYRAAAE